MDATPASTRRAQVLTGKNRILHVTFKALSGTNELHVILTIVTTGALRWIPAGSRILSRVRSMSLRRRRASSNEHQARPLMDACGWMGPMTSECAL